MCRIQLVAPWVIRASVLTILNAITVTITIDTIWHAIMITISATHAIVPVGAIVNRTARQHTGKRNQQYKYSFHIASWSEWSDI
jgi:hypothetical protein